MLSQPVLGASQAVDTPYPDSPWVVMKFGGRSVSTAENWTIVARLIRERLDEGVRPVVVHSALTECQPASNCRAMTSRWISLVPSPIVVSFTSRKYFSAG